MAKRGTPNARGRRLRRFKCGLLLSARVGRPPPPSPAARASPFLQPPTAAPTSRPHKVLCALGGRRRGAHLPPLASRRGVAGALASPPLAPPRLVQRLCPSFSVVVRVPYTWRTCATRPGSLQFFRVLDFMETATSRASPPRMRNTNA